MRQIHEEEEAMFQLDVVISNVMKLLCRFEDMEKDDTIFFAKGQTYMHKQPRELVGERTCDGHLINWDGVFENTATKKGKWWSRWKDALLLQQARLQEIEDGFKSTKSELFRETRLGKAKMRREQLEEGLTYLQTVESRYEECLERLQWEIASVQYQVMNRMGVYKKRRATAR